MRTSAELGALFLVASEASLDDRRLLQQTSLRELRHRVMAVAARQLVLLVHRAIPVDALSTFVAGKTLALLFLDWRTPLAGEPD